MTRRVLFIPVEVSAFLACLVTVSAAASSAPSGGELPRPWAGRRPTRPAVRANRLPRHTARRGARPRSPAGQPGSGGDFNVAWVPTLVLFTNPAAANTHIATLTQLTAMIASKDVITVPLNGTPFDGVPLPNLTFHCSVVFAAVYARGVPFTG